MSNKELSNCCKAQVKVDTADEGTSCYMCRACHSPCDLFMDSKEQINVVEKIKIKVDHEAWHRENKINFLKRMASIYFNDDARNIFNMLIEEYERLKRLDEYIKRMIDCKKEDIEILKRRGNSQYIIDAVQEEITKLESFYDAQ